MGVEGVYLNTDIDSAKILEYCYRFKNYINDDSYNRPFITSRIIEPILQHDISLTIDSSFTYFDTHMNAIKRLKSKFDKGAIDSE